MLERIDTEITTLARYRATWQPLNALMGTSAVIHEVPYFANWITDLYVIAASVGVRKMLDDDPRASSLNNLLCRIAANPERLTREWFGSEVYGGMAAGMDAGFTRLADPSGLGHIDSVVVLADRDRLLNATERVVKYANQHVVHAEAHPRAKVPTYGELHAAIGVLGELLVKYTLLLTKTSRVEIEPVIQEPWQRIFERPWSESEGS